MQKLITLLILGVSLTFFTGCGDDIEILPSTDTQASELSGSWIATSGTIDLNGDIEEKTYTESESPVLLEISDEFYYEFENDDTITTQSRRHITPTSRAELLFVNPGVSVDGDDLSVNITISGDNMTIVVSQIAGSQWQIITMEFSRYNETSLPTSWPRLEVIATPSQAEELSSSSISGSISSYGEKDWYSFDAVAGNSYTITTGGELDSYLRLFEEDGGNLYSIAENDDYGVSLNSQIEWTCTTSGTYYVSVAGYWQFETGSYTVTLD